MSSAITLHFYLHAVGCFLLYFTTQWFQRKLDHMVSNLPVCAVYQLCP